MKRVADNLFDSSMIPKKRNKQPTKITKLDELKKALLINQSEADEKLTITVSNINPKILSNAKRYFDEIGIKNYIKKTKTNTYTITLANLEIYQNWLANSEKNINKLNPKIQSFLAPIEIEENQAINLIEANEMDLITDYLVNNGESQPSSKILDHDADTADLTQTLESQLLNDHLNEFTNDLIEENSLMEEESYYFPIEELALLETLSESSALISLISTEQLVTKPEFKAFYSCLELKDRKGAHKIWGEHKDYFKGVINWDRSELSTQQLHNLLTIALTLRINSVIDHLFRVDKYIIGNEQEKLTAILRVLSSNNKRVINLLVVKGFIKKLINLYFNDELIENPALREKIALALLASHSTEVIKAGLAAISWLVKKHFQRLTDDEKQTIALALLASQSTEAIKAGRVAISWLVDQERFKPLTDDEKQKIALALLASRSTQAIKAGRLVISWLVDHEHFKPLTDDEKQKIALALVASRSTEVIKASLAAISWLVDQERFKPLTDDEKQKIALALLSSHSTQVIKAGLAAISWLVDQRFQQLTDDGDKEKIALALLASHSIEAIKVGRVATSWLVDQRFKPLTDDEDKQKIALALLASEHPDAIKAGRVAISWLVDQRFKPLTDDEDKQKIALALLASRSIEAIKAGLEAISWLVDQERFKALTNDEDKQKIALALVASRSTRAIKAGEQALSWFCNDYFISHTNLQEMILQKFLSSAKPISVNQIIPRLIGWIIDNQNDTQQLTKIFNKIRTCSAKSELYSKLISLIGGTEIAVTDEVKISLLQILLKGKNLSQKHQKQINSLIQSLSRSAPKNFSNPQNAPFTFFSPQPARASGVPVSKEDETYLGKFLRKR